MNSRACAAGMSPNVVVLFVDDLGWKDIGCYGGPAMTPTLDEMAAKGVRFTDFHAGCAVCSPSRAVALTGRHHIRAGVYNAISDIHHNMHLLERETTLAEVLKEHNYATAHFGKWHLGLPYRGKNKPTPDMHGFDYWFATENNANPSHRNPVNFIRNGERVGRIEGYACQIVVDDAISWLDNERDPNAPFFLNIWFHEPHAQLAAPAEIVSQYGRLNDPAAIYTATVDNTDRAIARLLSRLRQIDSLENTIIVYSSDNGSYRSDRVGNLRGQKGSNFEGGHRVPGIFYAPGRITQGRVEHEPAGMVDLLPTICGLLGIDKPGGVYLDGSDLTPLLTGNADQFQRHQPLFWLRPEGWPAMSLRDGNYTLIGFRNFSLPNNRDAMNAILEQIREIMGEENIDRTQMINRRFDNPEAEKLRTQYIKLNQFPEASIPAIKAGGIGRTELYDLSIDIGQQINIASQHPNIVARLKKQMDEIYASVMVDAPEWASTAIPNPDLDNNGTIDFQDFLIFVQSFGKKKDDPAFNATADLNGDDSIDFQDFLIFAQAFGN